jgi:Tfp pilus assembly protein PilN
MELGSNASFIPADQGVSTPRYSSDSSNIQSLLFLGSLALLVISGLISGAVFMYDGYLASDLAGKKASLKRAQQSLQPALIEEVARVDARIHSAQELVSRHFAPSALFEVLEEVTLQTVYFKSLDFRLTDATTNTLQLKGTAKSVNSIALQSDLFGKSALILNPVFANINRDALGVQFDINASINTSAALYRSRVNATAPAEPLPATIKSSAPGTPGDVFSPR